MMSCRIWSRVHLIYSPEDTRCVSHAAVRFGADISYHVCYETGLSESFAPPKTSASARVQRKLCLCFSRTSHSAYTD